MSRPNSTDLRILAQGVESSRHGQVVIYPGNGEVAAYERLCKLNLMIRNPQISRRFPEYQVSNQGEAVVRYFVDVISDGGQSLINIASKVIPWATDGEGRQLYCSICVDAGKPLQQCMQVSTPSGNTCAYGHGGAEGTIADDLPLAVRMHKCPVCCGDGIVPGSNEYETDRCHTCCGRGVIEAS